MELYRETESIRVFIVDWEPKKFMHVQNMSEDFLGLIRWNDTLGQYIYQSALEIVFNEEVLKDIADILSDINDKNMFSEKDKENLVSWVDSLSKQAKDYIMIGGTFQDSEHLVLEDGTDMLVEVNVRKREEIDDLLWKVRSLFSK